MSHRRLIPKSANCSLSLIFQRYFVLKHYKCLRHHQYIFSVEVRIWNGQFAHFPKAWLLCWTKPHKGNFFLSNLTFANSKFIRNVLPVPPGASKIIFPSLVLIVDNIMSYIFFFRIQAIFILNDL